MTTYAINGFGRIGKLALRVLIERNEDVAFINDPVGNPESHAHLLEFDSIHDRWAEKISFNKSSVIINGKVIKVFNYNNIIKLPSSEADVIIDCTGKFKTENEVNSYKQIKTKKVIVSSAIPSELGLNLVYGVNHGLYDKDMHYVISASSCTTNCLAPIIKVLHEQVGIKHGSYTTIHNATNTQTLVDRPSKDLRRSRSALTNLIPSTTNSASAITQIYPDLLDKLTGHAVRVPVLNSSLTDCCFEMKRETSSSEINALFREASFSNLKNILGYEKRPLVSSDYKGDERSAIIDALSTVVINKTQVKVYAWYDNEFAYTHRVIDLAIMAGNSL